MAEFINIYVDLERQTDAEGIIDPLGFVQCNPDSPAGTVTNPLNLEQFRTYLKFYHRWKQNFFLKGKIAIDFTTGEHKNIYIGTGTLFETPHQEVYIQITNWVADPASDDIDEPWSIVVSASQDEIDVCSIITNNDRVKMMNGEIEITDDYRRLEFGTSFNGFEDGLNNDYNSLAVVNMKLYTEAAVDLNAGYHPLAFRNYKSLIVVGSLMSNKAYDGSIIVENTHTRDTLCYFINDIFYGHKYMLGFPVMDGLPKVNAKVKQSSFTSSLTTFSTTNIPEFVYNIFDLEDIVEVGNVQFNWGGASACEESFLDLTQSANFQYLDPEGWIDISVSGIKNTLNYDGVIKEEYAVPPMTSFSRWRDGIGPLTFPTMGTPYVSASVDETSATVGDVSGGTYDTLYSPGYYEWFWDDYNILNKEYTSSTDVFSATHEFSESGEHVVDITVHSHNYWYKLSTSIPVEISFTSASYDYILLRTSASCFDGEIQVLTYETTANNVLSAYTFDEIIVSATNTSPYDVDDEIFDSWGVDWAEGAGFNKSYYWQNNFSGQFTYPYGTYDERNRYISSGHHYVFFGLRTNDRSVSASWLPVQLYERPRRTYYVDLDEYYEVSGNKWIYKQYGIYDTFESGSLDTEWGTLFKGTYGVVDMWGNKCASNGTANLFSDPTYYNFEFEWQFARTTKDFNPYFTIKSSTEDILKVEWDYDNDVVKLYHYGTQYNIKYKLSDWGYVKDLRCPNSLRFLPIKVVYVPESEFGDGLIHVYIKWQNEWVEYTGVLAGGGIEDEDKRLYMEVSTDATTGFGYIKLQSQCGLPYMNGSEDLPLTYIEFYRMTTFEDDGIFDNGLATADYRSIFKMKNYRKVTRPYDILEYKYFEIDAWDLDTYGPWMLIYDLHFSTPQKGRTYKVSWQDTILKNGIIYNIREETSQGKYVPNIELTYLYDMFVVWNSPNLNDVNNIYHGYIRIMGNEVPNRDYRELFSDYIGSTIKSERGFIMYIED